MEIIKKQIKSWKDYRLKQNRVAQVEHKLNSLDFSLYGAGSEGIRAFRALKAKTDENFSCYSNLSHLMWDNKCDRKFCENPLCIWSVVLDDFYSAIFKFKNITSPRGFEQNSEKFTEFKRAFKKLNISGFEENKIASNLEFDNFNPVSNEPKLEDYFKKVLNDLDKDAKNDLETRFTIFKENVGKMTTQMSTFEKRFNTFLNSLDPNLLKSYHTPTEYVDSAHKFFKSSKALFNAYYASTLRNFLNEGLQKISQSLEKEKDELTSDLHDKYRSFSKFGKIIGLILIAICLLGACLLIVSIYRLKLFNFPKKTFNYVQRT